MASWSSSQQSEDEVYVAARLAWTSAASRRATGKPDAVGIRAPPPGAVTGGPACRAHAGRLQAEIRQPSPFDEIADAAGGISRKHGRCSAPRSACACPAEARGSGTQAGNRARGSLPH